MKQDTSLTDLVLVAGTLLSLGIGGIGALSTLAQAVYEPTVHVWHATPWVVLLGIGVLLYVVARRRLEGDGAVPE